MAVYEDFEEHVTGWNVVTTSCNNEHNLMMGGYCKLGAEILTKTFQLPAHERVRVRFNVNFLDRWEADTYLTLMLDDKKVWTHSYKSCSRLRDSECYDIGINVCGDDYPDHLGHYVDLETRHSKESLSFIIEPHGLEDGTACATSWGIDDLEIYVK
jgi:hypothetical protein